MVCGGSRELESSRSTSTTSQPAPARAIQPTVKSPTSNMTVTFTPLLELNNQQLDKILSRFKLVSRLKDTKEKISVIKCIESYDTKFRDYDDSDVIVGFNKKGTSSEIAKL